MNKVILLGNLGADPELNYTRSGEAVLKLRLATSETFLDKDKNKQERTEWHSVSIWGKRGESLAVHLAKGSRLLIEGQLRYRTVEKDGQKRYYTEIIAREVEFAGGKGQSRSGGEDAAPRAQPRQGHVQDQDSASAEWPTGDGSDDVPF